MVSVACDPPPTEHYIQAWMEYKRFDEYGSYGRHVAIRDIPDRTGFQLRVHSTCVEGWFRAPGGRSTSRPRSAREVDDRELVCTVAMAPRSVAAGGHRTAPQRPAPQVGDHPAPAA